MMFLEKIRKTRISTISESAFSKAGQKASDRRIKL